MVAQPPWRAVRRGGDNAPAGDGQPRTQGPTTRISKVPGSMDGRGWGSAAVAAGAGPNWAVTRYTLWVFSSTVMVRAPRLVAAGAATDQESGESSRSTVRVPSPQEAKARPLPGSKPL